MSWNLDSDRPIFIQIIEKIQMDIISGLYGPGDKLPSVRDLAQDASVNPNTMQKALSELERTGLVYSLRTSGRFITEDTVMIENLKAELAKEIITQFLCNMQKLGIQKEEAISLISEISKGDCHDTVRM
ncbi:GntR family transcriptional regulator [Lachnospiraceae bacterium]|nr:GntR family transcriptional regulator [Lachnospiraceae bacterium]